MRSTINTAAFQRKVDDRVWDYLQGLAQFIENRASQIIEEKHIIDEGTLFGSITQKKDRANLSIKIGSNLNYASPVEFGTWASRVPSFDSHTIGMKPRPYLRPALDELIQNLRGKAHKR